MTKKPRDRNSNIGPPLHRMVPDPAVAKARAEVLAVADEVFDRYVLGESFWSIAESLPFKIPGWKLRQILIESEETKETYANANILRSHSLIEKAVDYGRQAALIGDSAGLKVAIDTNMKVAAKLNAAYSDKASLELTGKNGGALEIVADLSLTAEQAYERLIKG